MWHPPRSGIKPMSPALTGRFFTTEPPRKHPERCIKCFFYLWCFQPRMGFSGCNPTLSQRFVLRKFLLINECLGEGMESYFYLFLLVARPQKNYLTSLSSSFHSWDGVKISIPIRLSYRERDLMWITWGTKGNKWQHHQNRQMDLLLWPLTSLRAETKM